ncbi:Do family serine endopeptidase [Helicobacter equorum]|uniref:Do family serine endopeptidase n=1 Tax=Helicobacter equorum TaxID=361872 RepID=UPI000CF0AD6F|nr:Do family serine endopeptidase [Helicobacter equorum]
MIKACRILLIASVGYMGAFDFKNAPDVQERLNPSSSPQSIQSYASSLGDATKAVVNISTQKQVSNTIPNHPMFNDPFFQQFFGDVYGQIPRDRIERSLGSGVLISTDGYIITNHHVIDGADKILVSLSGSTKEYTAKIIGADSRSDLAVIKIDANTPSIGFANSDAVQVGDVVFAIGNPFGVGETVTQGIVSALNKSGIGINDYENFIQTDASINPGNSGGALIDSRGALIGINTAILSRTGGNHGVGFAIPSEMVKKIAKELIEKGSVKRGYLGVGIQDVSEDLQETYGQREGALLISIEPQSPAAKAGLMIWDLITQVDGKKITSAQDLKNLIGMLPPTQKVTIKYVRDKQERMTQVVLGELSSDESYKMDEEQNTPKNANGGINGLEVSEITQTLRQRYRIPDNVRGVVVVEVKRDSLAHKAGFSIGDVIAQVENSNITRTSDFLAALGKFKNKNKRILVYSRNGIKTIILK